MANELSISRLAGDTKSNAMETLYKFRNQLQQRKAQEQNHVGPGSLSHMLANYSSYSVDTSCARPTN